MSVATKTTVSDEQRADQQGVVTALGWPLAEIDKYLEAHGSGDSFGSDLTALRHVLVTYRSMLDSISW